MYNVVVGVKNLLGEKMFKKLAQKLILERERRSSAAINPLEVDFDDRKKDFLKKLTNSAINMYERNCDIKNFSKLVLSDPKNTSHDRLMSELFRQGVIDPLEDEKLMQLSDNRKFLRDLGLTD